MEFFFLNTTAFATISFFSSFRFLPTFDAETRCWWICLPILASLEWIFGIKTTWKRSHMVPYPFFILFPRRLSLSISINLKFAVRNLKIKNFFFFKSFFWKTAQCTFETMPTNPYFKKSFLLCIVFFH